MCGALYATRLPLTVRGLGGLIPTKTSGSVTQVCGMGLCDVDEMASFQVLVTICIVLFVLVILDAVTRSSVVIVFAVCVSSLITLTHLRAHIRCADSDMMMQRRRDAPFVLAFYISLGFFG